MALFLFDTLGDAQGAGRAYWVLIVIPLLPLIVYVSMRICFIVFDTSATEQDDSVLVAKVTDVSSAHEMDVEMTRMEVVSPMAAALETA